ncbi:MAG: putative metalloprotease CJM1_0395 family protein [Fibrobacterota bacterium]
MQIGENSTGPAGNSPVNSSVSGRTDSARSVRGEAPSAINQKNGIAPRRDHFDRSSDAAPSSAKDSRDKSGSSREDLSREEEAQVSELRKRDREVRAHEQAHIAAGGQYVTGGASYSYQNGPDGKRYAVGGEVGIDTSSEKSPEATIAKMQVVKSAAMAPAKPSGQDRSVAAQASRNEAKARRELREKQQEKMQGYGEESNPRSEKKRGVLIDITDTPRRKAPDTLNGETDERP